MKKFFILLAFPAVANAQTQTITTGAQKLAAFEIQKQMLQKSPYKNLEWRLIGPDNRSGRCTEVAGITDNSNIMYAGFATGGLWKTEDGGRKWISLFDKQATQSIGSFALAPSNNDIIYAGTGEANIFRASLPGIGMYKSENGGKSFEHIGLENTGTIARVVIHPKNPDIVYVAAGGNEWTYNKDRGVYLTKDGGKTWKKILYKDEKTGCVDLVMDPTDPNTLYASMWNRIRRRWSDPVPEDGDYIYKTIDGGKTWKIINKGLPDTRQTGRIGIAIAGSNSNVLYAFVDDHNIKREPKPNEFDSYERKVQKVVVGAAVYRSNDKGETWVKQSEVHDFFRLSGTYGWVFGQIRVNPKNENEVYVLGTSRAKSTDGGKTWKLWNPIDKTSDWIHGDNHALWIDENSTERVILGNDGGVSTTWDGGNKWKNFFDKLPTTQFYTITYDMESPFNVYGAVQDEGTMSGSSFLTFGVPQDKTIRHWMMASGGEGTQILVDPKNSNIIFSSTYYGRLMKSDMSKPDSLQSKHINMFDVGRIDSLRGEWLAGTLMSKFNSNVIYHGLQHLYKSEDGGNAWKIISPDLSYNNKSNMGKYPYLIYHQAITAIAEGNTFQKLWVGTDDGRVWSTNDDDESWQEKTKGLPFNKHVAKIVTSPFNDKSVYVVLNGRRDDDHKPYLFVTNDYGNTWQNISYNLPASPINTFLVDSDNGQFYCGTDMGVYRCKPGGKTWEAMGGNLPDAVSVNDMFIHPRDKKLVIATYGRGVWILDDIDRR